MNRLEHYYEMYEERAAIKEYDANMPKTLAEVRAYYEVANIIKQKFGLDDNPNETKELLKELKNKIKEK